MATAKRKAKKIAKKVVKKAKKGNKLAITLIVVVVIAVIAVGVVYVLRPDIIVSLIGQDKNPSDGPTGGGLLDNTIHEGDLNIYYIDVGQGDCIYIQFPDGKDMLVDCGSSSNSNARRDAALASLDNYNTDNNIDYLMLTHTDTDHVSFLDEVLGIYQVSMIYMPNVRADHDMVTAANLDGTKLNMFTDEDVITSGTYAAFFVAALNEPNCNIILNIGNFSISGENYKIDFFALSVEEWASNKLKNAKEINAVSPIGILQYNGKRIVLTGDSNEINEPKAVEKMKAFYGIETLDCDVLKVGHHGSESSSTIGFLDFITCEISVIMCGTGNTHQHPREDTMARLRDRNMTIYRTDLQGDIKMTISSDKISFVTAREASKEALEKGLVGKKG